MFAKIIVDVLNANVDRLFTYIVPDDMEIKPGHRVLVPFGKGNKIVEGYVIELAAHEQTTVTMKKIAKRIEPYTVFLPDQLKLAEWIAKAYHCTKIAALRVMLPTKLRGSKIKKKTIKTLKVIDNLDLNQARLSLLKKDGTARSPKQLEIFDLLAKSKIEMSVSDICAYVPNANPAINSLLSKGILIETDRVTFRNPFANIKIDSSTPPPLTCEQTEVLNTLNSISDGRCMLLHGVTGSGKTEVFLQAIEKILKKDAGAIVLVPEISLTPQTTDRFRARFGDSVAVLHSHLSDGERYDEWRRIRFNKAKVVVGARSAIFAPVENLKLIIIDEEHEPSYQSEITPKYSAIEVAVRRASITGAKLILASATPALTDYYKAKRGLYVLAEMPNRINNAPLPHVDIVDMRKEFLSGNDSIFSTLLMKKIAECIDRKEQIILFLNRRGYSSHAECRGCGFVFNCPNCDVALTYHKYDNTIRCHYCGAYFEMPKICPSCSQPYIKYTGIGTEQVEEQLKKLFPNVTTLRMDTDTTTGKNSHRDILNSFSSGKAEILIGTQMIAKGLDIPNVTLVGVVFADSSLFYSDYKSSERTFQLLTQVAGRAGRAEKVGSVVIQTNAPEHRVIRLCKKYDFKQFFKLEIQDRMRTLAPPFAVFIRAMFVSVDENKACNVCDKFASDISMLILNKLRMANAEKELIFVSSGAAQIKKRNNEFRFSTIIKLVRSTNTASVMNAIYSYADSFSDETFKGIDINPTDML